MILSQRAQELIAYYTELCGESPEDPATAEWLIWHYPLKTLRRELQRLESYLPKPLFYLQDVISRRIPQILHSGKSANFLRVPALYQMIAEHVQNITFSELEAIDKCCTFSRADVQMGLDECRQRSIYSAAYLLRILQSTARTREDMYAAVNTMRQQTIITMASMAQVGEDNLASALIERANDRNCEGRTMRCVGTAS